MDTTAIKKAVCAIIFQDDKILAVSRKDNHNDFNLVGGKVDDDDPSTEFAIIREAKEETGLDLCALKLIDVREWGGYLQHCYIGDFRGFIHYTEPHVVKWLTIDEILKGSFVEYNIEVFKKIGLII